MQTTSTAVATLSAGTAEVRERFSRGPCPVYTDWANIALPLVATLDAIRAGIDAWSTGTVMWEADFEPAGDRARDLFGRVVGVTSDRVVLVPAVSVATSIVAATVPDQGEIVVPDDEFTSILFPLLAHASWRDLRVRRVEFGALADAIAPDTSLVASSVVRSNGGGRQDVASVLEAAKCVGARVYLDASHAAGVLDLQIEANEIDFVAAAGYKHLLCPRGAAFLTVPNEWDRRPVVASWRGLRDADYYGGDLNDLAPDASGLDVSLAWHAWLGAVPALAFLASFSPAERERHCIELAEHAAERLGVPGTGSSVVGVKVDASPAAITAALAEVGARASIRAGSVRLSFHVYNTLSDATAVGGALARLR